METLLKDYLSKIRDENSNYFAGSACFLIEYLELSKIKYMFNNITLPSLDKTRYFVLNMIDEDSKLFDLTSSNNKDKMVEDYQIVTSSVDNILGLYNSCKECSTIINNYPYLLEANIYLKSLVGDSLLEHPYDLSDISVNIDLPCFNTDVTKLTKKYIALTTIALFEKLVKRKRRFKNVDNLPLDETLILTDKILTNNSYTTEELDKLKKYLLVIQGKIKSSIKKDYLLCYKILKQILQEEEYNAQLFF